MNKAELAEKLSKDAGISKAQAEAAIKSFTEAVAKTAKKDGKVTLVGFGTFSLAKRKARKGRNPKTGQENLPALSVSQVDLSPDGDTPENAANTGQSTPEVFPPLPRDLAALAGWDTIDEDLGQKTTFKPLRQQDRNTFLFEGIRASVTDPIFQTAGRATFHFDWNKGLITRIETRFSQGYGMPVRGSGTLELQQVSNADPQFLQQLAAESDVYFAATAKATQATETAALDPAQTDARLAAAEAALKDASEKITLPLLKDQLAAQIKAQPETAKFIRAQAARRAELLAAAPLDWTTTDLAGQPANAQAFRGKVVILNFWSRTIPWCITQMPALKTLQADFSGAPVAVLGLNAGDDPRDALAIAQAMQLAYPQLKGDALANQLKIEELPTTLVFDQTGKIRAVHTGFSPHLHDEVAKTVKALLGRQ